MNTMRLGIALSILMMLPISAASSEQLQVENEGTVSLNTLMGSVCWTGSVTLRHRGRIIDVEGRATLFSGPSIRRDMSQAMSAQTATFEVKNEWISLVALGDVTITGRSGKTVKAKHLVCVADGDQILADGLPLNIDKK
jgi:hypothetical protein